MKPVNVFLNTLAKDKEIAKKIFLIKILKENFNINYTDNPKESNLIIDFVNREKKDIFKLRGKKFLIIAGDNLFFRRNLFNLIESFLNLLGLKEKKYILMNYLDRITPKIISGFPIASFFPKYDKIINQILKLKEKEKILISTNKILGGNFFSMPLFIQDYFYKMKKLTNKKTPSNEELKKRKFCAFVVSSNSSRERIDFFKRLSRYKKVDSYGKVMNNMGDIVQKKDWKDNMDFLKKYKFVICFENSFADDYITEKLLNAMFANSIPIYRGAQNVGEYFNTKSFINYGDYGSYKKMIEKIIELDKDNKKYKKFLKQPWFKKNKIPEIIKNKKRELIQFYERILRSIYNKKYSEII